MEQSDDDRQNKLLLTHEQVSDLLALANELHVEMPHARPARLVRAMQGLLNADQVTAWVTEMADTPFQLIARSPAGTVDAALAALTNNPSIRAWREHAAIGAQVVRVWDGPSPSRYVLISLYRGQSGCVSLIAASRDTGPFERWQSSIFYPLHPQVQWVLEKSDGRSVTLAPGAHAVLELMLTGIGEKEIARRLNRSVHTVHTHIKRVYRHYEVRSRPELLLRFFGQTPKAHEPSESMTDE